MITKMVTIAPYYNITKSLMSQFFKATHFEVLYCTLTTFLTDKQDIHFIRYKYNTGIDINYK